jgi:hypothetical protein
MPTLLEFLFAFGCRFSDIALGLAVISVPTFFISLIWLGIASSASAEAVKDYDKYRRELTEKTSLYYKSHCEYLRDKATATLIQATVQTVYAKRLLTAAVISGVLGSVIGSLPDVADLWKVRVELVKFELASPENIKAGVAAIERIGSHFECELLGTNCPLDKK